MNKAIWSIAVIGFCLSFAGVLKGNDDAKRFAQIQEMSEAEFDARLSAELLAANEIDLQKSGSKYTGKASRHNAGTREQINGVKRDLAEQGLYEVKP